MSEINEILNVLYYVDEDIENIIQHKENEIRELKSILKMLDYAYKKIKKLEK